MWKKDRFGWVLLAVTFIIIGAANGLTFTVDAPNETRTGQWFNVTVNILSSEPANVTVYSYVYKGLNCIGQGWNINKQEAFVDSAKTVVLKDLVKMNTEEGIYSLRVKVNFDNQSINSTQSIYVFSQEKEFKESYLYAVLIVISLVGLALVFKYNR